MKETDSSNANNINAAISPFTIQYECNFIDIKGNIVRDRSFCETNKFNALLSSRIPMRSSKDSVNTRSEEIVGEKNVNEKVVVEKEVDKGRRTSAIGTWDISNPNVLSIQVSNGKVVDSFHLSFYLRVIHSSYLSASLPSYFSLIWYSHHFWLLSLNYFL